MWRGILRVAGRGLRHGLVVAGVCLGIALVTGVSGYFFADDPGVTRILAATPPRDAVVSSAEVLGRWVRTPPELRFPDLVPGGPGVPGVSTFSGVFGAALSTQRGSEQPLADQQRPEQTQPALVPATDVARAESALRAQRPGSATPRLDPGDRPVVSVSFYYCEEAPGGYERGDGGGFCGRGKDGSVVRPGVAACDIAYLGQRFRIDGDTTGRTYLCADTGSAVHGLHRDIWFLDNRDGWLWQRQTGTVVMIEVLP